MEGEDVDGNGDHPAGAGASRTGVAAEGHGEWQTVEDSGGAAEELAVARRCEGACK